MRAVSPLRLRQRVLSAIRTHSLWAPGDRVTVACSGGRDSVVLLDVLADTRRAHGAQLDVLTIDHGQHPRSTDDAAFVLGLAAERGLPASAVRVTPRGTSEEALRAARSAAFDAHGSLIATGHHQRDQAETLLLQLLRGTGSAGRRGIPARRPGRVRPLLFESPDDLGAWAAARGLTWRDDPSNASPSFTRNRLRHEVLPLLEAIRPGAVKALARSAGHAAADDDALSRLAAAVPLTVDGLAAAPAAVSRRALLRRWPELSAAQLDRMLVGADGVLPGHRRVTVRDGRWVEEGVGEARSGVTLSAGCSPEGPE